MERAIQAINRLAGALAASDLGPEMDVELRVVRDTLQTLVRALQFGSFTPVSRYSRDYSGTSAALHSLSSSLTNVF